MTSALQAETAHQPWLFIQHCTSNFSCCYDKIPDKNNLRKDVERMPCVCMETSHVNNKSDGLLLRQEIGGGTWAVRKDSGIEPDGKIQLARCEEDGCMVLELK